MKTCPSCGESVQVLIVNVQNGQRFCHHCSGQVCPTFMPYFVLTTQDVKWLQEIHVDPEISQIENHIKRGTHD
jgi:hypothetical protein